MSPSWILLSKISPDSASTGLARTSSERSFVAELENDSVGVIDFGTREIAHVITDVKRPQGLTYVSAADTLVVGQRRRAAAIWVFRPGP